MKRLLLGKHLLMAALVIGLAPAAAMADGGHGRGFGGFGGIRFFAPRISLGIGFPPFFGYPVGYVAAPAPAPTYYYAPPATYAAPAAAYISAPTPDVAPPVVYTAPPQPVVYCAPPPVIYFNTGYFGPVRYFRHFDHYRR
jgi:hypothetical protein